MDKRIKTACILAIWVCIMASHPGAAQNRSAKVTRNNSDRYNSETKAPSLPVVKSNAAKGNQEKTGREAADGIPHRIIFPTPVPIKSGKDPWDKAVVILTAALVIVGAFQILFLWKTVQATSENAKAARAQATHAEAAARSAAENAEAANANARAVEAQGKTMRETLEAIKRQADVMELQVRVMQQSAEMQEVGLRQWVSLGSWDVERVEGQKALFVHFKIENPTGVPLTLGGWRRFALCRVCDLAKREALANFHSTISIAIIEAPSRKQNRQLDHGHPTPVPYFFLPLSSFILHHSEVIISFIPRHFSPITFSERRL